MTLFATCNGERLEAVTFHFPQSGAWYADLRFVDEAPNVKPGAVTLRVGDVELKATIAAEQDAPFSSFALRRSGIATGGAGGWGRNVPAQSYRNDAGVKATKVIADVARAAGETLGTIAPGVASLGAHYTRTAGQASRVLDDVSRGQPWWIDFAGVTHVTQHTAHTPDASTYQVLNAWPDRNYVQLSIDTLDAIRIGSVIQERLPTPAAITALEISLTRNEMRAIAWVASDARTSKLADALRAIAQRSVDVPLYGAYRYRIVTASADRCDLQIVKKQVGLPDVLGVPVWPGIAGAHARLAQGEEVIVQFLDGDRSMPRVTGFDVSGANGAPQKLTLGGESGLPAARQGDSVTTLLPPALFSGTIGGVPATGVLTFPLGQTLGNISGGSGKVDVAT